ncbi:hypothetical protein ES708_22789 [subsurface metagenome]
MLYSVAKLWNIYIQNERVVFNYILIGFVGIGVIIFLLLLNISAPYGKHNRKGWGPQINNRIGWILMEFPAPVLFFILFMTSARVGDITSIIFVIIWEIHYFQRAFVFPFLIRGNGRIPLIIVLFGQIFNTFNAYFQGRWLFAFSPEYSTYWFMTPHFIIGLAIFIGGYMLNLYSDHIIRNLRKPGESGYKIPYGGLYRYVSCPNYLGELLEWVGWAILTWSLSGLTFALWTFANLGPRAKTLHEWYQVKFEHYPKDRKALIPLLW